MVSISENTISSVMLFEEPNIFGMQLELTVTNIEKSTLWDPGPIYDDRKNRKTGGNFNHEGHAT